MARIKTLPKPPKPKPSPILHLGTQFTVIVGRPTADGTRVDQAKIEGTVHELTEAAFVAAYNEVRAKFNEAGKQ